MLPWYQPACLHSSGGPPFVSIASIKRHAARSQPFTTKVRRADKADIKLRAARMRWSSIYKGYKAIFNSLAKKAVHLELVTGLITELFLLAFDRLTDRREMVLHLYSDNRTHIIGPDIWVIQEISCSNQALEHSGPSWKSLGILVLIKKENKSAAALCISSAFQ